MFKLGVCFLYFTGHVSGKGLDESLVNVPIDMNIYILISVNQKRPGILQR